MRARPYLVPSSSPAFLPVSASALTVFPRNKPVFLGISGGEGSYTEQAARQYAKARAIHQPQFECLTFVKDVLMKLQDGHIDIAVFGIVNSSGGVVDEYMKYIGEFRFKFVEIMTFEVNHMLLGLPGTTREQVLKVVSQEQALRQCRNLQASWTGVDFESYIDTATAAKHLSEGILSPDTAVIASEACAELYGLDILARCVQDKKPNITSFIVAEQLGA